MPAASGPRRTALRPLARLSAPAAAMLLAGAALAQGGQVALDLPAAPLEQALKTLARQSGTQIVFASAITDGKQAPRLHGNFTVGEALDRLLAGSGWPRAGRPTTFSPSARPRHRAARPNCRW